jgi:hypothetical protein
MSIPLERLHKIKTALIATVAKVVGVPLLILAHGTEAGSWRGSVLAMGLRSTLFSTDLKASDKCLVALMM